jgi:hypothetical protein
MKLFTVPNCESCDRVVSHIQENNKNVEKIELELIENKWCQLIDGHMVPIDEKLTSFPSLMVGAKDNINYYIYGDTGCISYIEKGFLHDIKTCPFLNSNCIENKCEKFVIMNKGLIAEGSCADTWTPILLTKLISRGE